MSKLTIEEENLKKVDFINVKKDPTSESKDTKNIFQQNLLLKAMQITSSPTELKKIAGFRNMTEMYKTIDKLALRKEYHKALDLHGIDFDTIVEGIKHICFNESCSARDRLTAFKMLLQSLGVDKYDDKVSTKEEKNWEDSLNDYIENRNIGELITGEYQVKEPEIPKDVQKDMIKEKKIGGSIYE